MSSCSCGELWLFPAEAGQKYKTWGPQHRLHRAEYFFLRQGTVCMDINEFLTLQSLGHGKVTARFCPSPASVQTGDCRVARAKALSSWRDTKHWQQCGHQEQWGSQGLGPQQSLSPPSPDCRSLHLPPTGHQMGLLHGCPQQS